MPGNSAVSRLFPDQMPCATLPHFLGTIQSSDVRLEMWPPEPTEHRGFHVHVRSRAALSRGLELPRTDQHLIAVTTVQIAPNLSQYCLPHLK